MVRSLVARRRVACRATRSPFRARRKADNRSLPARFGSSERGSAGHFRSRLGGRGWQGSRLPIAPDQITPAISSDQVRLLLSSPARRRLLWTPWRSPDDTARRDAETPPQGRKTLSFKSLIGRRCFPLLVQRTRSDSVAVAGLAPVGQAASAANARQRAASAFFFASFARRRSFIQARAFSHVLSSFGCFCRKRRTVRCTQRLST